MTEKKLFGNEPGDNVVHPDYADALRRIGDGLPTMGEEAETTLAKLGKGQEPMTEEKWLQHKDCETAPRDHKWQWKWDIAGHWTDIATCVHCGVERHMMRPAGELG